MALALLQGCAGRREEAPEADPAKVRAQLLRLLPAQARDREGWARDIQVAFEAQRIATSKSNLCAVLADVSCECAPLTLKAMTAVV